MLPHLRFAEACAISHFVNSLATCDVHHLRSSTRSVYASRVQRMMGMQGPVVTVVPSAFYSALLLLEKEDLSFETT